MKQLPQVDVRPQPLVFGGGLDLISPPGSAAAGTCRFALNYEPDLDGGYRRVGGFERFDGRPRPHLADYTIVATTGFTATVGQTVTGMTSGATGKVLRIEGALVGLGRVSGTLVVEALQVGATPAGSISDLEPDIDGFVDNRMAHAAANDLRADILKPPGTATRGVAVLNGQVYCWTDDAGNLRTWKATSSGWTLVPLLWVISFNAGSSEYVDGETLVQGANSALIKRVILESGDWLAGTAAGRFIIEPVAGTFSAGAASGGGVCNLGGAATQITQFSGGRVRHARHNFSAANQGQRLYCCDGVNQEWEFDGEVVAPITTGMAGIRATSVVVHKEQLFFAFRSSLQHSKPGEPFVFNVILGAGELGTGDLITNMVPVSGSESKAALMATCRDSAWVLYGNDAESWDFKKIADEAGALPDSALEWGGIACFDDMGGRDFRPTQSFGNFSYELNTRLVQPLVRGLVPNACIVVKGRSLARWFFSDGLVLSCGLERGNRKSWMPLDYGRTILIAEGGEIGGEYRVFMVDADGWVLEADVGRSFDGGEVRAALRMNALDQRSPMTEKQYRHLELDSKAESAFELAVAGEFSDTDPDSAGVPATQMQSYRRVYGTGLMWDFGSWDRAYWDAGVTNRVRYPMSGKGRSLAVLLQCESDSELPHTLQGGAALYTVRRLSR